MQHLNLIPKMTRIGWMANGLQLKWYCKDHPYPGLELCWTMPSQVPYHALISNHPPSFPASFNPSHHLSLTVFSLFHSDVLTLVSLGLSGSHASTLDLILTTSLPTHVSHVSTMALWLAPSMLQHPVKWVLLSSLILFLSSLIILFHPFIPFIALPLSCCLSSFTQWLSLASLATVLLPLCRLQAPSNYHLACHQHHPSHSKSHSPDHITCLHQPHTIAPHSEWATDGPCYCTDCAPAVISTFSFTTFPLFPSSTTFLPLCSLHLNYHPPSCHWLLWYILHWPPYNTSQTATLATARNVFKLTTLIAMRCRPSLSTPVPLSPSLFRPFCSFSPLLLNLLSLILWSLRIFSFPWLNATHAQAVQYNVFQLQNHTTKTSNLYPWVDCPWSTHTCSVANLYPYTKGMGINRYGSGYLGIYPQVTCGKH